MNVGELILKRRTELGLTLEEVGNAVGVSKSTVKKWEDGYISNMRRDKIAQLASILQVNPISFITEEEWDKEAEEFEKKWKADSEWLKKYLNERFSEEDVSTAYELIEQLPKFNREGLIKILERMDELSELNKYLAQIDLVE